MPPIVTRRPLSRRKPFAGPTFAADAVMVGKPAAPDALSPPRTPRTHAPTPPVRPIPPSFRAEPFSSAATRSMGWPVNTDPANLFHKRAVVLRSTVKRSLGGWDVRGATPSCDTPPKSCACPRPDRAAAAAAITHTRDRWSPSAARAARRADPSSSVATSECASLDEAFEHALVDEAQSRARRTTVQRRNLPARRARQNRRDGTFSDILHRPSGRSGHLRVTVNASWLLLMSGGSTETTAAVRGIPAIHGELVGILRFNRQQRRSEMPRVSSPSDTRSDTQAAR